MKALLRKISRYDRGHTGIKICTRILFLSAVCTSPTVLSSSSLAAALKIPCGNVAFSSDFMQANGTSWPAPWVASGDNVDLAEIQNGAALLRSNTVGGTSDYPLARMVAPLNYRDVELRARFMLEDPSSQGVGFYVRQNGGSLIDTVPAGQGYGVFIEGPWAGRPEGMSFWQEVDGIETVFSGAMTHTGPAPQPGVFYNLRFQVYQSTPNNTYLRAKFWPDDGVTAEPEWQISVGDSTSELQGVRGGIAVDSYQHGAYSVASIHVDDIEVEPLCNTVHTWLTSP